MKNSSEKEKILVVIGSSSILIGVLFNEWILTVLFSPDGMLELSSRRMIWIFDILCILLGYLFVKYRSLTINMGKFAKYYRELATICLSTCLLFLSINVFLYVGFKIGDMVSDEPLPVSKQHGRLLGRAYPGLSKESKKQLLNETWSRPYTYEPYTQFKERPYRGKYVNVDENGFRYVKNQGPWPPDDNNFNIFLFGGSTVFNYGVPDDQTIASYLQEFFLNANSEKKVCVYNFGRGHYFSSQERILYEKLLSSGFIPQIAIFIDGYNEFYYAIDEPIFTNRLTDFLAGKKRLVQVKKYLSRNFPLLRLMNNLKEQLAEKYQDGTDQIGEKYNASTAALVTRAINRYVTNRKLIEAVSKAFNVKSVFVWQPAPTYKYDLRYHIFADVGFGLHIYSKYGYPHMAEISKRGDSGDNFLWLADIQENMKKLLYVDRHHYSSEMSKIIANNIYLFLMDQIISEAK